MHEEVEVHGRADCICAASVGGWHAGCRGVPEDGCIGGDLLSLEAALRRDGSSELRKMRQMEDEKQKLKRLVADLSLDKAMLQEVLSKKV